MANALEETGLEVADVAVSLARVFGLATQKHEADVDAEHPGWEAAARVGLAIFGDGDDEVELSFTQVGSLLRKAFARAAGDGEDDLPAFDALDRRVRLAWVALARHLANLCNFEPADTRRLETHEAQIADWVERQLNPEQPAQPPPAATATRHVAAQPLPTSPAPDYPPLDLLVAAILPIID